MLFFQLISERMWQRRNGKLFLSFGFTTMLYFSGFISQKFAFVGALGAWRLKMERFMFLHHKMA